jgi:hypothetical protein
MAERFPELMLPGLVDSAEGVALAQTNEAFVEAFLLGANRVNYSCCGAAAIRSAPPPSPLLRTHR